MKLPYQHDARRCYEDVRNVPILGEAVQRMMAESQTEAAFEARHRTTLDIRQKYIAQYREQPLRRESLKEEADFVCASDDLLLAAFMGEIERIEKLPAAERGTALDAVARLLEQTDLNPSWNSYTRPRIAGRILEVRDKAK